MKRGGPRCDEIMHTVGKALEKDRRQAKSRIFKWGQAVDA